MDTDIKIAVIGLGYLGLSLAHSSVTKYPVVDVKIPTELILR